jgi:signal transduction histidine kinase
VQQAVDADEPVKTSLAKIVKAAVRGQEGRLKEKNIHVQQTGLEDVEIANDALQLQTAVEEILKNSIEAMSDSESKWITVIGIQENGRVNLKIEDTGTGIEKENLDKVFDPFFSTKDEQGVSRGLGLNVVRRVLEEMGGVVKIKNREMTSGVVVDLSWPSDVQSEVKAEPAVAAKPVDENALSAQALLDDLIGVGAPDDFAEVIMNAPLVKSEKFPEVAIRRPKVMRTLD